MILSKETKREIDLIIEKFVIDFDLKLKREIEDGSNFLYLYKNQHLQIEFVKTKSELEILFFIPDQRISRFLNLDFTYAILNNVKVKEINNPEKVLIFLDRNFDEIKAKIDQREFIENYKKLVEDDFKQIYGDKWKDIRLKVLSQYWKD